MSEETIDTPDEHRVWVSPDGRHLVLRASIWSIPDRKRLWARDADESIATQWAMLDRKGRPAVIHVTPSAIVFRDPLSNEPRRVLDLARSSRMLSVDVSDQGLVFFCIEDRDGPAGETEYLLASADGGALKRLPVPLDEPRVTWLGRSAAAFLYDRGSGQALVMPLEGSPVQTPLEWGGAVGRVFPYGFWAGALDEEAVRVAALARGRLFRYQLSPDELQEDSVELPGRATDLVLDPTANRVAAVFANRGNDRDVWLWRWGEESFGENRKLPTGPLAVSTRLEFSPDGNFLASVGRFLDIVDVESLRSVLHRESGIPDGLRPGRLVSSQPYYRSPPRPFRFSRLGTLSVARDEGGLGVWETHTGEPVWHVRLREEDRDVMSAQFAARDSLVVARLASGETLVFAWRRGLTHERGSDRPSVKSLAGPADGAWTAMEQIRRSPSEHEELLSDLLDGLATARDVNSLLSLLDSDDFDVRDAATRELREHGYLARSLLRAELEKADLSVEARVRLERLIAADARPSGTVLRDIRTLELLGWLGTERCTRALEDAVDTGSCPRVRELAKSVLTKRNRK